MTMTINDPAVMAEVSAAFRRYEYALTHNVVTVLDELFWDSPYTVRYGAGENLYGFDAIRAFRAARPAVGLERVIARSVVTTYGTDAATTCIEFFRDGSTSVGRQTQSWIRMPEGWRVVAAHVSLLT